MTEHSVSPMARLLAARAILCEKFEVLSSALLSMSVIVSADKSRTAGTAATSAQWVAAFDEEFIGQLTTEQLQYLIMHELWHLLAADAHILGVAVGPDPRIRNCAADLVINATVDAAGLKRPPKGLFLGEGQFAALENKAGKYDRKFLYDWIVKNIQQQPDGGGVGNGQCGTCARGDPGGTTPEKEEGALTPEEIEMVKDATAKSILEAKKLGRGTIPGEWTVWAEGHYSAIVPWQSVLRVSMRRAVQSWLVGHNKFSLAMSRERAGVLNPQGFKARPFVSAVVDTSGSVAAADVMQAMAEAQAICKQFNAAMDVAVTDAAVHRFFTLKPGERITQDMIAGGGGTDMNAGINRLIEEEKEYAATLIFTDGYTPWPERAHPRLGKYLAIIINGSSDGVPSFMRTVIVNTESRSAK